ncbi:MAG: hypothetical protein ABIF87_01475 [Pseudomonadota bacterium]
MKLRNLGGADLEKTVWRYMSFAKFISFMTYQALWFSKLNILQDTYEGMIPAKVKRHMHENNQRFKPQFNTPEFHKQIDSWLDKNEGDSRELLVVSCWFLGESESERMWREYGGSNEAIAIKSTVGRLARYVLVPRDEHVSHLGLVSYVDHDNHEMSAYDAHQGHERAFLKDNRFAHEQEIRIVTLNIKTTSCASMEGKPYTEEEVAGKNMNNFENPGLYVGVHLNGLITEVVVSPTAQDWFEKLVKRIVELSRLPAHVSRSRAAA